MTVDGRPAWSIRAEIEVDYPDLETKGDTVEVIVVDTGSPESLAMFIGAVDSATRTCSRSWAPASRTCASSRTSRAERP